MFVHIKFSLGMRLVVNMVSVCDVIFLQFTWVAGEGGGEDGAGEEDEGEEDRDVRSSSLGTLIRTLYHNYDLLSELNTSLVLPSVLSIPMVLNNFLI